jgi:cytochrome P450
LLAPPDGFIDNPYPWYATLQAQAPRLWLRDDSVLLTRYADVVAVYRSAEASSDKQREFGPKFGAGSPLHQHHTTSLVFNDAPAHTRIRRILMGALNQRAIARMEAGLEHLVAGLLDRMAGLAEVDLIEDFAARIPVEVIGNLLDVPAAERGPLRDWSLAILSALEPAPTPDMLARGHRAVDEFCTYLRSLIARRRATPGDPDADVLTRLLQAEPDGSALSEAELLHNCIFLLNAGHETTTNLIGNGVHALLQQRDQWEMLHREPQHLGTAVEELLRFESPLQLNNRLSRAPITLPDGTVLPQGCFITLGIGAANRDPAQFADAQTLNIQRRPNLHLAFGHSAHACAGMNVARLEARVALGQLVQRFPKLRLYGIPQRDRRLRFRGFLHLPVEVA